MKMRLKNKINLAFFLIVLLMMIFIGITSTYFFEKRFEDYTVEKIKHESYLLVNQITQIYHEEDRYWNLISIENIGVSAMERGFLIKVSDSKDHVLWNAMTYNKGYCSDMLTQMEYNMKQQNANFQGSYEEKRYALLSGDKSFGSLTIGYYGPYFFNDNDVKYVNGLKQLLFGAGLFALGLSLVLGFYISVKLSRPLIAINENAQKIMQGNYGSRATCPSTTLEICELSETINALSEALDIQEELRKRLTSDIAHELRTPITTLQSHLELMIEGIWQADPERLEGLLNETSRLSNLVCDLSKIAQLEREQLIISLEELDLHALAIQVVETIKSEYYKKEVDLVVEGELALMMGDALKLKQVLINLLNNALKYTPKGGAVKVAVHASETDVALVVSDTGIGIPAKDMPHIFERFYRVDKSRARQSGGVGIGLSIVKAIVNAHGGQLEVRSEEQKGSVFTVRLPK
ncbi:sensor histidine kinase [Fusibacter ferrireducens]|uniref:histidine kinase n=1 Tax=Fusibacter ferrireducens TaxID=2785058 RepID=A0ABR9ZWY5_9FIRM|nr:ATP-binding protein [Fusibacter ferrireducens]MBF4694978.1 GHKL domain-containing protein [Fusibacter ferrireducens]